MRHTLRERVRSRGTIEAPAIGRADPCQARIALPTPVEWVCARWPTSVNIRIACGEGEWAT